MEGIRGLSSVLQSTFNSADSRDFKKTDNYFATFLVLQWVLSIVCAVFTSPTIYRGMEPVLHEHVWTALLFGGAVTFVGISFALVHGGHEITRHVVAIAQVLMAVLLVYLMGGVIEDSLLLFVSFVVLIFYRDWRVLITAAIVIGASSPFIAATHQLI